MKLIPLCFIKFKQSLKTYFLDYFQRYAILILLRKLEGDHRNGVIQYATMQKTVYVCFVDMTVGYVLIKSFRAFPA